MKTYCSVPAKLILSGEHAVLYQCPALSMAINLHTDCRAEYQKKSPPSLTVELSNFNQTFHHSFAEYRQQTTQIEQRYQQFLQDKTTIQNVLTQPIDLIFCTLHHFEQQYPLNAGQWHFNIQSNIPIGRGLGSSAAVILCLLGSLIKQHDLAVSQQTLLRIAKNIEARQHGQSSGIDPATLIYAGLLQYQTGQPIQPIIPPPLTAWLIDTGEPESSTGECVASVKLQHQNDAPLWQAFTTTTQQIISALQHDKRFNLKQGIRQNHRLLTQIGVVPEPVQTFITALHTQYNAAAKICGAGSIMGNNAGVVLCLSEQDPSDLCQAYGYSCQLVSLQQQGVRCERF